jgi:hypothetical protein
MPFKMTPLTWVLGAMVLSNAFTAVAVLYIAFGTPKVFVSDDNITAFTSSHGLGIDDRYPIHVVVVGK